MELPYITASNSGKKFVHYSAGGRRAPWIWCEPTSWSDTEQQRGEIRRGAQHILEKPGCGALIKVSYPHVGGGVG